MKKALWDRSEIVTNARKFLRGATGKEQRVRELSDRVLQPLIATLRETAAA